MTSLRMLLLCLSMLAGPAARADGSALALFDKISVLKSQGKLPGLAADGITLPQALVFDQLQQAIGTPEAELEELVLSNEKGTLRLIRHGLVETRVSVDFSFGQVDWPRRLVWIDYSAATDSASESVLGRLFGTLAILAFEAATGAEHVKSALSDKPYLDFEKNRIGVRLDQIPSLSKALALGVGNFKLFDHVGIKSIHIEPARIRIALGLVRN